jgi:hypothetical protein
LLEKNIDVISQMLGIDKKGVYDEWTESLEKGEPVYYVVNVLYKSLPMPYLIYTERDFLTDFAKLPLGINDRFVPVVQVKADS